MNIKLQNALEILTSITITTTDYDSLVSAITESKDEFTKCLQLIGDGDFEGYIEATHMTLFKVCPNEIEQHVAACAGVYQKMIVNAWEKAEQGVIDYEGSVNEFLGVDSVTTPDEDTVSHLNNCLGLNVSDTPVNPAWKF